jgi:hypothetical protein
VSGDTTQQASQSRYTKSKKEMIIFFRAKPEPLVSGAVSFSINTVQQHESEADPHKWSRNILK